MRYGVLGTGRVGQTIGTKLIELGHEVCMGSRSAANETAGNWVKNNGDRASAGTFADAAAFGQALVNATSGANSLAALEAAGASNLGNKLLIDIANPIDTSHGMPPSLSVCNTDSLGEQIQRAFPDAFVVKTLNTVSSDIMVNPGLISSPHNIFLCGDNADALTQTRGFLNDFGWNNEAIIELGGIESARGTEAYLLLWLHLWQHAGTPHINVSVVTA